jgi:hypothetical protein
MSLTKVTYAMIQGAVANVLDFGAKGDGVADDTVAIQAAIDSVKVSGGAVYLPTGTYNITDTIIIDTGVYITGVILFGDGRNTIISQTGTNKDAFHFSTTQFLQNSGFRDLHIVCGLTSGHCINIVYGCTTCFVTNVDLSSLNPAKAVIYGDYSTIVGGGIYDTKFSGGTWYLNPASTEAGVRIMTNNTIFNENVFENLRVYQADTLAFFHITAVAGSQYWLYNNTWKNINFEICKGGGFHFSSANRYTIQNCSFWDSDGPYKNNLIDFVAGAGIESAQNTIINVGRNGDTLAAFVNDIRIVNAEDTLLINCFTQAGDNPRYNFSGKRVTVIGKLFGTIDNPQGLLAINDIDGIRFPQTINAASLNYYDKGNWTATLTGSITAPTTPVTTTGTWQRVGDMVTVVCNFTGVTTTGASGNIAITGLPFASSASFTALGTVGQTGFGADVLVAQAMPNTTQIILNRATDINAGAITYGAGTGQFLGINLTYKV